MAYCNGMMDSSLSPFNGACSEENSCTVVSVRVESHGEAVLRALQAFRVQGHFFDFTLHVAGISLPCHRCILAASSDFFRAMFELDMRERDDGGVVLPGLSPTALQIFLDFAYTGCAKITEHNAESVFQTAAFLQAPALLSACGDYLADRIDAANCLPLLALSESYGSSILHRRASHFAVAHFTEVVKSPEFVSLCQLKQLLRCLSADDLAIKDEMVALDAALYWIQHDAAARLHHLPALLKQVRLHQIPKKYLQESINSGGPLSEPAEGSDIAVKAFEELDCCGGLFPDARPSTTRKYIFVHKTDGPIDGGVTLGTSAIRHTFCYDVERDSWKELSRVPLVDLPGMSLAPFAESVFVTGGCRQGCCRPVRLHISQPWHEATADAWLYRPGRDGEEVVPAPSMLQARTMHASVAAGRELFVIGGKTCGPRECGSLLAVEALDPVKGVWTTKSQLPRGIYYPEVAACRDVIYVLGSRVETSDLFNPSLDCFLSYSVFADQWTELVAEFGHFFHATLVKAVAVHSTLYICDLSTYKVYSFWPEKGSGLWKGEGSFECVGFNAGAVSVGESIFMLGGDYSPEEVTDEVQVYHRSSSKWEEVSPMPHPLTEFHCGLVQFPRHRDPWKSL